MEKSILEKRPHLIPSTIAAAMLLGALLPWPYGYYQLLRLVVCGASVYVAFMAYQWQKILSTWMFGFIAILFNPLIPIHLSREIWQTIDVICGLIFIAGAIILSEPIKNCARDKNIDKESKGNKNDKVSKTTSAQAIR